MSALQLVADWCKSAERVTDIDRLARLEREIPAFCSAWGVQRAEKMMRQCLARRLDDLIAKERDAKDIARDAVKEKP